MKTTERFAFNYLIFRHPTDYFLVLIPVIAGVIADIFLQTDIVFSDQYYAFTTENFVEIYLLKVVQNYLLVVNIAVIILMGFFISYRWSNMQFSGGYGFWLTLGANRRKFFINAFIKIFALFYTAELLGLLTVIYLNQLTLGFFRLIMLFLLVGTNLLLQAAFAVFLGNFMKNPELAALIFISVMATNILFNNKRSSIFHLILRSDLHFSDASGIAALALAGGTGVAILIITLRMHLGFDIDT